MTYGGTAATLTASYTGLVNSDTASSLTTAVTLSTVAATSNAGTYTITASGAVDPNYTISYASGTLTIGQAALTITANNESMTYGGTAATLTASYTGLVNSDTASSLTTAVTLSTVAATSNAGHVHDHGERGGGSELHDQLRQRHADDRSGGVDDHGRQPEHDLRRDGGDADGELHGLGQQRHGQQPDDGGRRCRRWRRRATRARTRSRPAGRWIRTTRSATPAAR